jgi:hypothetical protein
VQIVRRSCDRQSARIFEANLRQHRLRLVLGCKWAEPQAIPNPSVVDTLNLIEARVFVAGKAFGGDADRRGRRVQIDHEGTHAVKSALNIPVQDRMSTK